MAQDIPASLSRTAYLGLVEAHEHVVEDFRALFRSQGLTPTQFNVLRILAKAGPEGLPCGEIAAELLNRVPDVTRLLDRMARNGLIRRTRSSQDRRIVLASIEEKGLAMCEALYQPIAQVHSRQFANLEEDELAEMVRLLRKTVSQN